MLLVFDWDGTLMDSMAKIVGCMQLAIKDMQLPASDDATIKAIIGLSLPVAIQQLYPRLSLADGQRLSQAYIAHFKEADQQPCALYPDVERVLAQLREGGHSLAVATSKSRKGLTQVLSNLGWQDYFDASRCADEAHSKPDPLMLNQLLSEFSVPPQQALMVGDTEYDLEMAANASVASVAVSYGAHARRSLLQHQPLACIDSFAELLEWV